MKENWMNKVFSVYDKMLERTGAASDGYCETECNGFILKVNKNVYAPDVFMDSIYFSKNLPQIIKNSSLLEIGTGSGVIGISCASLGAKVTMTDINPDAVYVAGINARRYGIDSRIVLSDIYDALGKDDKYDFIFWSHPYNNWDEPVNDMLLRSGLDYRYNSLRKYIEGARNHLLPGGKLLLGTGNTADVSEIFRIADKNRYAVRIIQAQEMPLSYGNNETIINMIFRFDENV